MGDGEHWEERCEAQECEVAAGCEAVRYVLDLSMERVEDVVVVTHVQLQEA